MAGYVDLAGVSTWYDERGDGDPLVLLHGGFTGAYDFEGNLAALADRYRVFLPERRGHAHTPDVPGPISLDVMAQDTIAFLDKVVDAPARLVGYSAGAVVALLAARRRPDLVDRLVLVSGWFHRDGPIFAPSAEGELPQPIVEAYAAASPDGVEHLPVVRAKLVQAAAEGPLLMPDNLAGVTCRTLVMAGDDDLVTLEHTLALYRGLPDAELAVVPRATHLLLLEKPLVCAAIIRDFLAGDPGPTLMPIRRAT